MTMHYFAIDGNYGDATSIQVVDTDKWDRVMWDYIDAYENDRAWIAHAFATGLGIDYVKQQLGE